MTNEHVWGRKEGVDAKGELRRFLKIFSSEMQRWNVELIELARRRFEEREGIAHQELRGTPAVEGPEFQSDEEQAEEAGEEADFQQPILPNLTLSQRTDGNDRNVTPTDERRVISEFPGTASTSAEPAVRRTSVRVLRSSARAPE
jgi:hypothetical protein